MHTFSMGMRQKVLLISSLIHNPDILLWDEPLSGIDYNTTIIVRNLIKELSEAGKTFFYSTHLIESIDKICTKVIILSSGKIAYDGAIGNGAEEIIRKYAGTENLNAKVSALYNSESSQ
jgi:ABC-2 type transport system ATP-binding protein